MKITNHLEEIAVYERKSDAFRLLNPHIEVIQDTVISLDPKLKIIALQSGSFLAPVLFHIPSSPLSCEHLEGLIIPYDKVCICSGASPLLFTKHPNIIGIRDLEVCRPNNSSCHFLSSLGIVSS
jgi:hypothetical protein